MAFNDYVVPYSIERADVLRKCAESDLSVLNEDYYKGYKFMFWTKLSKARPNIMVGIAYGDNLIKINMGRNKYMLCPYIVISETDNDHRMFIFESSESLLAMVKELFKADDSEDFIDTIFRKYATTYKFIQYKSDGNEIASFQGTNLPVINLSMVRYWKNPDEPHLTRLDILDSKPLDCTFTPGGPVDVKNYYILDATRYQKELDHSEYNTYNWKGNTNGRNKR